jgi:hypothetical protein
MSSHIGSLAKSQGCKYWSALSFLAPADNTHLKEEANEIAHSGEETWRSFFGIHSEFLLCKAHIDWFNRMILDGRITEPKA